MISLKNTKMKKIDLKLTKEQIRTLYQPLDFRAKKVEREDSSNPHLSNNFERRYC